MSVARGRRATEPFGCLQQCQSDGIRTPSRVVLVPTSQAPLDPTLRQVDAPIAGGGRPLFGGKRVVRDGLVLADTRAPRLAARAPSSQMRSILSQEGAAPWRPVNATLIAVRLVV
jgi:hypothetical protein